MATSPSKGKAALLRSPRFRDHDPGDHVENPHRLVAIDAELDRQQLDAGRPDVPFAAADLAGVERIHDPRYVDLIARAAAAGGGWLDSDTYLGPESFEVAMLAAGAGVAAVDAALDGTATKGFVLARPPGHHATPRHGMGFCLLNTIAIAGAHALARGITRVLIVDWDVHHGNGTQDAFYETDQVLFCSIHQSPFYPGTGAAEETGSGRGQGYTLNIPLRAGQGDPDYVRIFDERILPAAQTYRPELILISAGFDAHAHDPLGGMRLTEIGFATLAQRVVDLAAQTAADRVVAILEGGYDPDALARSVASVLRVLDGEQPGATGVNQKSRNRALAKNGGHPVCPDTRPRRVN